MCMCDILLIHSSVRLSFAGCLGGSHFWANANNAIAIRFRVNMF